MNDRERENEPTPRPGKDALPELSDELISAYLDNELDGQLRARLEKRLETDDQWRRILEELRAIRGSIQLLPRYQLAPDFSRRVLRSAEREMLSQSAEEELAVSSSTWATSTPHAGWRSHRWGLAVVAVGALAAGLLLVVLLPPEGSLVRHSPPELDTGLASTAELNESAGQKEVASREVPGRPGVSGEKRSSRNSSDMAASNPRFIDAFVLDEPHSAGVVTDEAGESLDGSSAERQQAQARNHQSEPHAVADNDYEESSGESSRGIANGARLRGLGRFGAITRADSRSDAKSMPTESELNDDEAARDGKYWHLAQLPRQPDVIVTLYMPLAAWRGHVLDQSLRHNDIYFENSLKRFDQQSDADKELATRERGELGSEEADKLAAESSILKSPGDRLQRDGVDGTAAVDLVYVQASPAQIQATLSELYANPQKYHAVAVESRPDLDIDQYERYRRGQSPGAGAGSVMNDLANRGAFGIGGDAKNEAEELAKHRPLLKQSDPLAEAPSSKLAPGKAASRAAPARQKSEQNETRPGEPESRQDIKRHKKRQPRGPSAEPLPRQSQVTIDDTPQKPGKPLGTARRISRPPSKAARSGSSELDSADVGKLAQRKYARNRNEDPPEFDIAHGAHPAAGPKTDVPPIFARTKSGLPATLSVLFVVRADSRELTGRGVDTSLVPAEDADAPVRGKNSQ